MFSAMRAGVLTSKGGIKSARYWRILANDVSWVSYAGNDYYTALYEIRFYASTDASGTNLNIGATASAKSSYGGGIEAANGNDDNTGTFWVSFPTDATPQWWSIDYGSGNVNTIKSVQLYTYAATAAFHAKSYILQFSNDNSNWSAVATFSTALADATQTFTNLQ